MLLCFLFRAEVHTSRNGEIILFDELKLSIYTGKFVNANTITFSQLVKQIYDEKLAMNEIQPQTYYRTMETVKLCKEINDIPVQKIDSTAIKQLLLSKVDYANSTIKKMYIILNQCFKEALKRSRQLSESGRLGSVTKATDNNFTR